MPSVNQLGHNLAKLLGIKLEDPEGETVTSGESILSANTADGFIERQPTSREWLADIAPSRRDLAAYLRSLFPFLSWIWFYNLQWFIGDLVAGVTIGAVVVPQGMAYAKLASLPVEFGLYSSFMGVLIYWFFATSKDITIGPVAVVSTVTGNVVANAVERLPQYTDTPWVIASALALVSGAVVLFIGLIRCGWIVELIPLVSLAAFMTGSAINIAAGQVPTMMGITGFSTRDSTYLVIINTLKNLDKSDLNAAMGLTALVMLYLIRFSCSGAAKKFPNHHKLFFFLSTLRAVFVILLYTMISWLVNMNRRKNPAFAILKDVPGGFRHAAVPTLNSDIIESFISELPATVIVLLIEHIAISKSFGRVNNYTINPSQEMVAIGVTNVLAPFLGGFPSTGSFSRTAIKSKAGVRTPFAGVITAIVVLLAIYALTAVFYYIPSASLAAVIIHAVGDLITPPNTLYKFWRVSPIEVFIFFVGVITTVFSTIENGIYATVCISFAVFIFRVLRSRGRFLGRVQVHSVLVDRLIGSDNSVVGKYGTFNVADSSLSPPTRNIFLPIDHGDGSNPAIKVASPSPGVFIYRFSEVFNYPSASSTLDYLTRHILGHTRRTESDVYLRPGDRPWNDPGNMGKLGEDSLLPTLKAVILDFSSVNNVDVTSVQQLIDVRNQLDRYTAPDVVDWHFACISNRWTKRALVSAGFGYPTPRPDGLHSRWKSIFSVAEIGGSDSAAAAAEYDANEKEIRTHSLPTTVPSSTSLFHASLGTSAASSITKAVPKYKGIEVGNRGESRRVTVHGLNRPLFHVDLTSALQSAIANVQARDDIEASGGPHVSMTV
ncbi:putative sulfate permease [Durotheca rogersii]|uniref:putative sulfate permease n=1 Tax=Durotheca rogersii TaxID=419775 RepID=UPI0022210E2F|nr:putative sulfate permease [Durotheca rogersii]KAI5861835.1 putative sulfate permease [Durotheca rogersii]